ncbi:hypothetical protein JVU11DRAFT_4509 [Chiua virens]|nr:hypothetical protein JVU11DRAFT_4509 [Chiua virens]
MMSLIFGWVFEDLWIDAQRGLCEALCAADRPAEAIEALHEMNYYFDNEVRPSQSTTNWVTDFKQRCALTLERNGDAALAINDYKEGTTHYTLALQLCLPRQKPKPKTTILKKWVKAKLTSNDSWTEALSTSVEFKVPRLAIYQVLCDFLAEVHRIPDAIKCLLSVSTDAKAETIMNDEFHLWVPDFYHRCGDTAMHLEQYDVAIEHYSAAAVLQPQNASTFFKRSQARVAIRRWDDALQDANEAVRVDPSSPMGYEMQYTVFYGTRRYDEAIDAFEKMLFAIEQSKDPEISTYAILKQSPLVLIDVTSGHLYSEAERRDIFERDLTFKELIASMSKELDEGRIQEAVDKYFGYAMLSHVWTRLKEGNEPKFADLDETKKTVWDLPKTPPCEKLRKFCHEARNMGFKWGWSDTICIDKTKSAYPRPISSIHVQMPGDLRDSIWMTRAWTLQELLAPKVIIFYDSEWKRYLDDSNPNHKKSPSITQELAAAITLSSETIVEFHPENLRVREKLRLASTRRATIVEDVAYSLIGIFKSDVEPRPLGGEAMETSIARLRGVLAHHEIVKFYNEVSALPSATLVTRRLSLPSIIFRVDSLVIEDLNPAGENMYTATIPGIGTVTFTTADTLSPREAKKLILAYPWIQYIRGPLRRTTQEHMDHDIASPPPAVVASWAVLLLAYIYLGRKPKLRSTPSVSAMHDYDMTNFCSSSELRDLPSNFFYWNLAVAMVGCLNLPEALH